MRPVDGRCGLLMVEYGRQVLFRRGQTALLPARDIPTSQMVYIVPSKPERPVMAGLNAPYARKPIVQRLLSVCLYHRPVSAR